MYVFTFYLSTLEYKFQEEKKIMAFNNGIYERLDKLILGMNALSNDHDHILRGVRCRS
jgi:hypothetical protein